MWTPKFWKDVVERTIRTAAQAFVGSLAGTALVTEVKWDVVASTTALATIVCVAMALAAPNKDESGNASFREDAAA